MRSRGCARAPWDGGPQFRPEARPFTETEPWRVLAITTMLCAVEDYAVAVRHGIVSRGRINPRAFNRRGELRRKLSRGDGNRELFLRCHFEALAHYVGGRGLVVWWESVMPAPSGDVVQRVLLGWTRATVPRQRFWRPGDILEVAEL